MSIFDRLRSVVDRVVGAPVPSTGTPPVTPQDGEPLSDLSVAQLRAIIRDHDRGIFTRSGLLADLVRHDADVMGALQQRLLLQGAYETKITGPDGSDSDLAWESICPPSVAVDLWTDAVLLGFGLAQVVWRTSPDRPDVLLPRLHSVHPSAIEWSETEAQWYVSTTRGRHPITPGDGQWVLYAPRSDRAPWRWGALAAVGEWYLSDSFAAADGRRRSEVVGQGIWKAKLPAGGAQTPDGKSFVSKLRTLGRGGVIPIPQGSTPESSYDVELVEAAGDLHAIFEWLMRTGGGRIRLAILGQDLTSQNNSVGTNASSNTGADVLRMIVRADAKAWEACIEEQLLRPLDAYLGRAGSELSVDYDESPDPETMARAQTETARAAMEWRAAGVAVDMEAMADSVSVPRLAPVEVVAPAPVEAPATQPEPAATLAAPDLSPPKGVREACARGLVLYEEGKGGDGLVRATVDWARRLARGENATRDKLVKMRAWHARHEDDRREGWDSPPTPGYVAFLLWGGAAGRSWAEAMVPRLDTKARALAAPKLPTGDDITREMVRLLQAHGVAGIPDVLAALEGAQPAEVRDRLAKAIDKTPPAEMVREIARGLVLARLVGKAQAVVG